MSEIFNILTVDREDAAPVTGVGTTYQEIGRLTTVSRVAGEYLYRMSMRYTYDHVTSSAYFRYSIDGGVTWFEMVEEPKDVTSSQFRTFSFLNTLALDGAMEIIIEAKAGDALANMNISYMQLSIERKG